MRFFAQLSVRLFVLLAVLLVAAFSIYVAINYDLHRQHLERRTTDYAATTSDILVRSAEHEMMANDRAQIAKMLSTIGEQPQVAAVNIYNKAGQIVYSTERSDVGHTVDLAAAACSTCHVSANLREVAPTNQLARRFLSDDGTRVIGFIRPILNKPACATGECHVHPASQRVLGVLDLQLSLAQTDLDLEGARAEMIRDALLVTLFTGLGAWLFITLVVRRPVRRLIGAVKRVGRLERHVTLDEHAAGELGQLSRGFNTMARQLERALDENAQWAASLEAKVEAKAGELQRAQIHLIHNEKLASLGKLSAVIAHEINNPLAGILTYARLVSRRLGKPDEPLAGEERARLLEHLEAIVGETRRCGNTVKNLLLFSRLKAEGLCPTRVAEVIEQAARLVNHRLEIGGITLALALEVGDDTVVCNVDQLQQVIVALLINAAEAMADGGRLSVSLSEPDVDHLRLTVTDTGPGIPDDVLPNIFVPFFTTKSETSGVGLGLAVVHGIVKSHHGSIEVRSSPDGTTFDITLPRHPPAAADDEDDAGDASGDPPHE